MLFSNFPVLFVSLIVWIIAHGVPLQQNRVVITGIFVSKQYKRKIPGIQIYLVSSAVKQTLVFVTTLTFCFYADLNESLEEMPAEVRFLYNHANVGIRYRIQRKQDLHLKLKKKLNQSIHARQKEKENKTKTRISKMILLSSMRW